MIFMIAHDLYLCYHLINDLYNGIIGLYNKSIKTYMSEGETFAIEIRRKKVDGAVS